MSNTTATISPWLKWSYRHGALKAEEFDTLDEAVGAAIYASEEGMESLQTFEGPDGEISDEEMDAAYARVEQANEDAWRRPSGSPVTHNVRVRSPRNDDFATLGWFSDAESAEAYAAECRLRFGSRVSVHEVRA